MGAVLLLRGVSHLLREDVSPPSILSVSRIAQPLRVSIPRLAIDAQVVQVGLTPEGNMDVPKDASDVGWYTLGVEPGAQGNAVMAGHLNDANGKPGVFWDLKRLKSGDLAAVSGEQGEQLLFRVETVTSYPYDESPLQEIFVGGSGRTLVLITCGGEWDRAKGTYKDRTVVFAQAI